MRTMSILCLRHIATASFVISQTYSMGQYTPPAVSEQDRTQAIHIVQQEIREIEERIIRIQDSAGLGDADWPSRSRDAIRYTALRDNLASFKSEFSDAIRRYEEVQNMNDHEILIAARLLPGVKQDDGTSRAMTVNEVRRGLKANKEVLQAKIATVQDELGMIDDIELPDSDTLKELLSAARELSFKSHILERLQTLPAAPKTMGPTSDTRADDLD